MTLSFQFFLCSFFHLTRGHGGKNHQETLFVGTIAQHSLAMSSPLFAIPDMTVREVKVTGNHMLTGKLRDQIDEIWANF